MVSYTIIGIVVAIILLIVAIVWYVMASQKLSISFNNTAKESTAAIKVIYTNGATKVFRNIKPGMIKNAVFKLNDKTYAKSIIIQPDNMNDNVDKGIQIEMNLLKGSKIIKKHINNDDILVKRDFVSTETWPMEKKPDEVLGNLAGSRVALYWAGTKIDPAWPFTISDGKIAINFNAKTIEGNVSGALIDLNVEAIKEM